MIVSETGLPGVKLVEPDKFGDSRGFFSETFNFEKFNDAGIHLNAVQDNHSFSAQVGTVRGLHFQSPPFAQAKLVRVTRGAVLDVAVDIRHGSPTFAQHVAVELSAAAWNQLYIPRGFAHGLCTLEPDTEFLYKVDNYYAPDNDMGIAWDDPALNIEWPVDPGVAALSDKDMKNPLLADLPEIFTYQGED